MPERAPRHPRIDSRARRQIDPLLCPSKHLATRESTVGLTAKSTRSFARASTSPPAAKRSGTLPPMSLSLPRDADGRVLLMGLSRDALADWLGAEIEVPASKIDATIRRMWTAIYRHGHAEIATIPGIRGDLRQRLAAAARIDPLVLEDRRKSTDGTEKFLFRTDDGAIVESVLIPGRQRLTLCISSQIGCAMRCAFCLTGTMGLRSDLNTAEIIGQVVQARRALAADDKKSGRTLSNVVFMGMGEPLHNCQAVIPAT
ncbi:MAG TPA: hypothetical protein ENK31_08090, partial [Nannocystis exedens]|nr:hypothetical protein [Nannocystis exedens]